MFLFLFIFIFLCVPIISFYNFHSFIFFFLKDIQVAHMVEELVNNFYRQMKEEEGQRIVVMDAFSLVEKRI